MTRFVGRRSHSRARGAIALSLVAHAIVGSIAAASIVFKPPAATHVGTTTHVDEPIEVVFVDPPSPNPPARAAVSPSISSATTSRHATIESAPGKQLPASDHSVPVAATIAASPRGTEASTEPVAAAPAVDGARGLPSVRAEIDRLAERSAIAAPTATAPGGEPPGTDTSATTFTIDVDADGNAHIHDRRNLQRAKGHDYDLMAEKSRAEQWLDAHHEQSNAVDMKIAPVGMTVVTFDVSDWAMRSAGQDPYAFQKLKQLDATREQRAEIGARHRARQIVQTPALVRESLAQISALAPADRHAALVELWRSCDTTSAGEVARATITRYVSEHPAFSADDRAVVEQR